MSGARAGGGITPVPLQELQDGETSDCSGDDLEKDYQHQPVCEIIEGEGFISFPTDLELKDEKLTKPNLKNRDFMGTYFFRVSNINLSFKLLSSSLWV